MKPATLKALHGSIRKWESIVDGTGADDGTDNCPLCLRFNHFVSCESHDGELCPVAIAAGRRLCRGTPYDDWRLAVDAREMAAGRVFWGLAEHPICATDDETVMCAVLELEFLRDLLPKKKKLKPISKGKGK